MANRDRVKLAFIHVPTEGFRSSRWTSGARPWPGARMDDAGAGLALASQECRWDCLADRRRAGLDWRQHSLAGWLASSGDKQAAAADGSAHYPLSLSLSQQSPNGAA